MDTPDDFQQVPPAVHESFHGCHIVANPAMLIIFAVLSPEVAERMTTGHSVCHL